MFGELVQCGSVRIISVNRKEQAEDSNSMREPSSERAVGHARYDGTVQASEGESACIHGPVRHRSIK